MNRRLSLSDSDLDAIDGFRSKLDTLKDHSHFFNLSNISHAHSVPNLLVDGVPQTSVIEEDETEDPSEPVFPFDNRLGLAHDLTFLAGLPELCDVTFLVGEDRQPVCGVKAILAARSKSVQLFVRVCAYVLTVVQRFSLFIVTPLRINHVC